VAQLIRIDRQTVQVGISIRTLYPTSQQGELQGQGATIDIWIDGFCGLTRGPRARSIRPRAKTRRVWKTWHTRYPRVHST
jgi:hypothetical protein